MKWIVICMLMLGCAIDNDIPSNDAADNDYFPVDREYVVTIPETTVTLVPPWSDKIPEGKSAIVWRIEKEIYIYGYDTPDGKLTWKDWVMGHEVRHLMNWADDRFADPDGGE